MKLYRKIRFYLRRFFHRLYDTLHLEELVFFWEFLCHRYSPKQFNPYHVADNIRLLVRVKGAWFKADKSGKLKYLPKGRERSLFLVKNFFLLGALNKRVERALFYSLLTLTLEIQNPFSREYFLPFLQKKLALLRRLLTRATTINGHLWDQSEIHTHIAVFERNSYLQAHIIRQMKQAVRHAPVPEILHLAQQGLQKGLYPVLATVGGSGAYWMRGPNREVLGLFKPFDEEIFAPNNPVGATFQGALGSRRLRKGCRVGESPHHEVGAFMVDEFFGFGIVPKTYYASFEHHVFYSAREDRLASWKGGTKTKFGSFQEYVGGFVPIDRLAQEEIKTIPLDEYQLLVVLDVILGNTDRNIGNILFGAEKIAAIDHGLCFPDVIEDLSLWYWSRLEQGKQPLFPSLVELLNHFPLEKLAGKLIKHCSIPVTAIDRLRERLALFTAAVNAGLVPAELEKLLTWEYLFPLKDLNTTLLEKAAEQLQLFKESLKLEK